MKWIIGLAMGACAVFLTLVWSILKISSRCSRAEENRERRRRYIHRLYGTPPEHFPPRPGDPDYHSPWH